jgi:hypothetical protein
MIENLSVMKILGCHSNLLQHFWSRTGNAVRVRIAMLHILSPILKEFGLART